VSKKNKKRRRKIAKFQERSDRRTADFLVRRIEEIQTELGDLIPDLQTFDHWTEIAQTTYCIRMLEEIRKKYRKVADGHVWKEDD
jgi:hypothetical protein